MPERLDFGVLVRLSALRGRLCGDGGAPRGIGSRGQGRPHGGLVDTARWAHASLAIVVPVLRAPGYVPPAGGAAWDLEGLFAAKDVFTNPNKVAWDPIADERMRWALSPVLEDRAVEGRDGLAGPSGKQVTLAHLAGAAGWLPSEGPGAVTSTREPAAPLPAGCEVRAVEVLHFPNYLRPAQLADGSEPPVRTGPGDVDSFVVVHVLLSGPALDDPGSAAAYFAQPAVNTDLRVGYNAKDPQGAGRPPRVMTFHQWAGLLGALGCAPIGPTGAKVARRDATYTLRAWRPFVVSHLVPDQRVPASPFLPGAGPGHWSPEQAWGWRMTGGQRLTQTWEPGHGVEDPARDGLWIGSTWVRATSSGLAFVATRGLGEQATVHAREGATWWRTGFHNVEHVRTAGLAHRNAVRLATLAIRQSEKLQVHAEALAQDIEWPAPPPSDPGPDSAVMREYVARSDEIAKRALELELGLIRTRNQVWFSQLPGHPEETGVLQALQSAARTPELLADIALEQAQVSRVLDQQAARVSALYEKAAAEREKKLSDFLNWFSTFIGLFFIVDIALAVAQVHAGGGWHDVRIALLSALPLVAVFMAGLGWLYLRSKPAKKPAVGEETPRG